MITDIFLSTDQIADLRFHIRGFRGAMNNLIDRCERKDIAARSITFAAVTPEDYDGQNVRHRAVTNEAVKMLREEYGKTFPWAEVTADQPAEA